jgi:hypothetical protein
MIMTVRTNTTGAKRKELVKAIADWMGEAPAYKGAPSFAYQVGFVSISKDGELTFANSANDETVERLLTFLYDSSYEIDYSTPAPEAQDATPAEGTAEHQGYSIVMPASDFDEVTLANLRNIIDSKANLIKKAFGATELPVNLVGNKYDFPWFPRESTIEELNAYLHFVTAICEMAKKQKRVTAKEKQLDNEKYAFRCFLLRLGFIGNEYKQERKILLRNLEGSSAFKSGNRKEAEA